MKRQDRKTQNIMLRFAMPLLFGTLMIAPIMNNNAQAKNDSVQQWVQTKRVNMALRTDSPAGDYFVGKVNISNIAGDFRFDPRNLDDSRIMFAASFIPAEPPPGKRKIDEDVQRAASMLFESTKIRQTGDNAFEVLGMMKMNERAQQVIFPMTIAYGGVKQGQPALVFSGEMNAPVGQMAPELALPKYLPIQFAFETVAAP